MSRQQIKLKAKEDIRGRVFACFIPFLVVYGVQFVIDAVLVQRTYGILPLIISIAMYPLTVGIASIYLGIVNNRQTDIKIGAIFSFYKNVNRVAQIFIAYIVSTLYIILGFILLVIPGIMMVLRYTMLPYVLAEYDDITWRDALKKCKEITDGRKAEIFVYALSFFGWFVLVVLTVGILSIYVLPYYNATMANLYYVYNPKIEVDAEFLPVM